jgi:hypothetical protein
VAGVIIRSVTMPPRLPVPADDLVSRIVRLTPADCQFRSEPLTLRITRVRVDISRWYAGDWVWLEGDALDDAGHAIERTQALVAVAALATT